ncbi:MAG: tRNA(5-methylaminomethyl-2-thiouridylate) methyltransferase, partial [Desulfovibrio sp.]|nr:tRNA(5-methylaminomethyl-2-thiouridylate) methyltransferase [Desulfovibrio sp.]
GDAPRWLCVGRNEAGNEALKSLAGARDLLFETVDHPGPTALGRVFPGAPWDDAAVRSAAAFAASFSGKAVRHWTTTGRGIAVRIFSASGGICVLSVNQVRREAGWKEYAWTTAKEEIRAEARARAIEF